MLVVDRVLRTELRDELRRFLALLAEIDALAAAAILVREGYGLSEIVEESGPVLEGEDIWHPFLPEGIRNPVSLRGGQTLVFLTGPNMAGKTTYLKAVGVCVYLAQCGLPVPAKRFTFAPVDHFVTGLSPEDDLREGISYFLAEVRRVKNVLQAVAAGRRTIAIFDEVFRGTNLRDALEASKAVLVGCSRAKRSTFIFSSHLVELAEELKHLSSVEFRYFDGELEGHQLHFDYRLRSGVSTKRFGMELLRREGLPDLLAAIPNGSVGASASRNARTARRAVPHTDVLGLASRRVFRGGGERRILAGSTPFRWRAQDSPGCGSASGPPGRGRRVATPIRMDGAAAQVLST